MPVNPPQLAVLTTSGLYSDYDIPLEDLAYHIAVAEALETRVSIPAPSSPPPSLPAEVRGGRKGWKADVQACQRKWGKRGVIQGYAGIEATIEREWWDGVVLMAGFGYGDADDSVKCELTYETVEGSSGALSLQMVFDGECFRIFADVPI
jgi:hypothetical protein